MLITILIVIVVVLIMTYYAFRVLTSGSKSAMPPSPPDNNINPTTPPSCTTCAEHGRSSCADYGTQCEAVCMMNAAVSEIIYFEDEELDRFKGKSSDSYTDAETEEFREVLYTMKPEEVPEWNRSLILRGINLPNGIKDELMLLMAEK